MKNYMLNKIRDLYVDVIYSHEEIAEERAWAGSLHSGDINQKIATMSDNLADLEFEYRSSAIDLLGYLEMGDILVDYNGERFIFIAAQKDEMKLLELINFQPLTKDIDYFFEIENIISLGEFL